MLSLNFQRIGTGPTLLILHGLFGSLDNWGSVTRQLAEHFDVISVDLRNHGRSEHAKPHSYPAMCQDVIDLLSQLKLSRVLLMGHSMGGKVAMQLALQAPSLIERLIVVDIAPVHYPRHHDDVFRGLEQLDLTQLTSRSQADQQLQPYIEDGSVRLFLLKNLYRNESGQFAWRFNLTVLREDYDQISQAPSGSPYQGPTLFIKGERSAYITAEYRDAIIQLFPQAGYKVIQDAGHWPHAEKPELFLRIVNRFLQADN